MHTGVPAEQLTTPRLQLRQWRADDHAPFAALNADPQVMAFFPAPLARAASDAMAERCQALIAERGWGFWAVDSLVHGSAPQFIGFVGLHTPAPALPFSPCVEIGWRLARPYWGQGLASEAARAALRVGFELLGLNEIVSFTATTNLRSRAVMERIGMCANPAEQFDHPALPLGHPLRAHCLYRLARARWAGPQAAN